MQGNTFLTPFFPFKEPMHFLVKEMGTKFKKPGLTKWEGGKPNCCMALYMVQAAVNRLLTVHPPVLNIFQILKDHPGLPVWDYEVLNGPLPMYLKDHFFPQEAAPDTPI